MNRVTKELKKNKYTTIAVIAFVVLLVIGYFAYSALFGSRGTPSYGNRLDGIDAVMPSSEEQSEVIAALEEVAEVSDADFSISGRTINIIITVKAGTTQEKARALPSVVIAKLSQDQISYFDVQVFIKCENEEEANYPIIAYKEQTLDGFTFTNAK